MMKKQACENGSESASSPPWNLLGAKPKHYLGKDKGRRTTGKIQHLEINEATGWPTLPSHRSVSSTPVLRREEPWIVSKTKSKSKPIQDTIFNFNDPQKPCYFSEKNAIHEVKY